MKNQPLTMASFDMEVLCQHTDLHDWIVSIAALKQPHIIATRGILNRIYIWDFKSHALIRTLKPEISEEFSGLLDMAFHPTLPYFAYIETAGTVCLMETLTWEKIAILAEYVDDDGIVVAFDPRLPRVVIGCLCDHFIIWDFSVNSFVADVDISQTPSQVSVSFDSSLICVLDENGQISIFSAQTGKNHPHVFFCQGNYSDARFSSWGPFLLTASSNGEISAWDIETFRPQASRFIGLSNIMGGAVSQTAPLFAVRSSDGPVLIWNFIEDFLLSRIETPPSPIAPICFSGDGQYLLVGGEDRCVRKCPIVQ